MNVLLLKNKVIKNWRILGLFFVFFCLRLYHLDYCDLWYDEISTINYAQYPWGNWNAPLYWIGLHFWTKIFGISEFSLRFPSLMFSFSSVILVFFLGKELFNKKIGFIAGIFMGLSPFHLWYAQEARDYSMLLFFGLLSSLLFYKALKGGRNRQWLFFIFVSFLGIYTNYFYIFLFLTQFLYLIFFKRLRLKFKEIIVFLIIALGFCFYLPRFLNKFYYVWEGFWIPEPQWNSLLITLENFVLGYNGTSLLYFLSNILMVLFFIYALAAVYKKRELRQNFAFCLVLFFVPILTAFIFSKVFFSVYLDRGLIIFSPYYYLILAVGVEFVKKERLKLFSIIAIGALLCWGDYAYYSGQMHVFSHSTGAFLKKPFKPIVKFIANNFSEDDIIGVTNIGPPVIPSLSFYSGEKLSFYVFYYPGMIDPNWQRPIRESNFYIPYYKINKLNFGRLWVISSDGGERRGGLDNNSLIVNNWFEKKYKLEFKQEFDGLWIFRYVKNDSGS